MSFLWDKVMRPIAFRMDAEHAHELGIKALASGFAAAFYSNDIDPILECERFGLKFRSPLGIAAGFDKNGVVVEPLARLGFGFVEVGTVTAKPQRGNAKPRLFRVPDDRALINRLGFNNDGGELVAARLAKRDANCIVGVNIGRNKDVANDSAAENYVEALQHVLSAADYLVVNVSSPNTAGLRELQGERLLSDLLKHLQERNSVFGAVEGMLDAEESISSGHPGKPLLIKIAPDLPDGQIEEIVEIAIEHKLAGIIATNTTISRADLKTDVSQFGEGGLSGEPLRERSTDVIKAIYNAAGNKLTIIGVGGIFTAEDAFEKITAGASLVQAYTGFVYGGPGFPRHINDGLAKLLRERGFSNLDEAVGSGLNGRPDCLTPLPHAI